MSGNFAIKGGGVGPLMANAILNFHFDFLTTSLIDTANFAFLLTLCVSYISIYLLCLSSLCCDFLVQSLPAQFRCILQFCRKVNTWSRSQLFITITTILLNILCENTIKRTIRNEKKKQRLTICMLKIFSSPEELETHASSRENTRNPQSSPLRKAMICKRQSGLSWELRKAKEGVRDLSHGKHRLWRYPDLKFVKNFTRPDFCAKSFTH